MILHCIGTGIRTTASAKRVIAYYYILNLVLAGLVAWPLSFAISDFAGNSLIARDLVSRIDPTFLFEFLKNNSSVISMTSALIAGTFGLSLIIGLFFSAGAISVFRADGQDISGIFWKNVAAFAGRFVRLALWSLLLFAVCYSLQFLEILVVRIFAGSDPMSNITFWGSIIRVGIGFLGIILYESALDYAKIDCIINDERRTGRSLIRGLKFVLQNPGRTIGMSLILFILGLAVLAIYILVAPVFTPARGFLLICAILFQQLYIVIRSVLRLTLIGAELRLRNSIIPANLPPVQPDLAEWIVSQKT